MIPDSGSVKEERDLVSRLTLLFVVGLMLLFGAYGVRHLLYTTPDDPSLRQYVHFALALGLVATVICGLAILKRKHWHIERAAAVSVFLLGLLYMFAMTPLSVPDEDTHYPSAYALSNVFCLQWDRLAYGQASDFDYSGFTVHRNVGSAYGRIAEGVASTTEDDGLVPFPHAYTLAYPMEYLPQAVGISLGRLFQANFTITFFLGRLFNLLFYVLCVYFAVRTVPKFKLLFGLIGMLPMTLHQAASYSYDGFINGMSLLLIALILRSVEEESSFTRKEAVQIGLVSLLLAPAKMIYWVITLLVLLIPGARFKSMKQRVLFIGIVLAAPLLLAGLLQLSTLSSIASQPVGTLNWEGGRNYTLGFILHHPVQTARIFLRTFYEQAAIWFECSIGAYLSGLSLKISNGLVFSFVLLLLITSLSCKNEGEMISGRQRVFFIGIFISVVFLTMLYMFLIWTSDYHLVIQGVQGRYFVPVLPLLFLSCNNNSIVLTEDLSRQIYFMAVLINLDIIIQVLTYTVAH